MYRVVFVCPRYTSVRAVAGAPSTGVFWINCVAYPSCSFSPGLGCMSGKSFSEIGSLNSGTFASGSGCDFGLATLATVGLLPCAATCACATPASNIQTVAAPNNKIFVARNLTNPTPYAVLAQNHSPKYPSFTRYAQRVHPVPCTGTHLLRSLINEIS